MVRPADGDFRIEFDTRSDEEIVNWMVDEACWILIAAHPDDDRLEIMYGVAEAFQAMLSFPPGQNFTQHDELLGDCLQEILFRIKTEQDRRLGHLH